jgi:hypothetical protein
MPGLFDNIKRAVESVTDEVVETAVDTAAAVTDAADELPDPPALPDAADVPELTMPAFSTVFDAARTPSPIGPAGVPLPYPNLGVDLPGLPDLPSPADPDPLTMSMPHVGKGSAVPTVGAPDVVLGDPETIELPDLRIGGDDGGVSVDVDPIMGGTPTAHGGVVVGGVDIDASIDGPGMELDTEGEIIATVDPMFTGMVANVGGVAAGGDTTIDLQPDEVASFDAPAFDAPALDTPTFDAPTFDAPTFDDDAQGSTPDDFESTIDAIDDTAEQFDIFDN